MAQMGKMRCDFCKKALSNIVVALGQNEMVQNLCTASYAVQHVKNCTNVNWFVTI